MSNPLLLAASELTSPAAASCLRLDCAHPRTVLTRAFSRLPKAAGTFTVVYCGQNSKNCLVHRELWSLGPRQYPRFRWRSAPTGGDASRRPRLYKRLCSLTGGIPFPPFVTLNVTTRRRSPDGLPSGRIGTVPWSSAALPPTVRGSDALLHVSGGSKSGLDA